MIYATVWLPKSPSGIARLLKAGYPCAPFVFTEQGRQLALGIKRPDPYMAQDTLPDGRIIIVVSAIAINGEVHDRLIPDPIALPIPILSWMLTASSGGTRLTVVFDLPAVWQYVDTYLAFLARDFHDQFHAIQTARAALVNAD